MLIRVDDLSGPEIRALLEEHVRNMHEISPRESVHALDLAALQKQDEADGALQQPHLSHDGAGDVVEQRVEAEAVGRPSKRISVLVASKPRTRRTLA